ncbi:MAG: type II toxin-antitoxin system Phd/YefM family antitoxin [Elainellaceae cyanobacterium]
MVHVNHIHSLTDFRRNSKEYIEQLKQSKQPMVLTVNGEATIVVQDADAFQDIQDKLHQLEEELQALKLDALKQDLQVGIDQLEAGEYSTYTTDTLGTLVERVKQQGRSQQTAQD